MSPNVLLVENRCAMTYRAPVVANEFYAPDKITFVLPAKSVLCINWLAHSVSSIVTRFKPLQEFFGQARFKQTKQHSSGFGFFANYCDILAIFWKMLLVEWQQDREHLQLSSLALSLVGLIHCQHRLDSCHHLNNKIDSISNCHCHLNPGRWQRTTTPLLHWIEVQCILTAQNSATQCLKIKMPCNTMQWFYTGTIF